MLFLLLLFAKILETIQSKPTVDVALETVLEFDDSVNPSLIDNIKLVFEEIKAILTNKKENKQNEGPDITDFLEEVLLTVKSLNNDELVDVIENFGREVNKIDLNDPYLEFGRRFLTKHIGRIKNDPTKIRNNLDHILTNLREKNSHRQDNFFLNLLNTLYKRSSKQKYIDILKEIKLFRRKSQSGNEIRNFVKKIVNNLFLDKYLNITDDKRKQLKMWLKNYIVKDENDEINTEYDLSKGNDNYIKTSKYVDNNISKRKFNRKKAKTSKDKPKLLTHITLYPETDKKYVNISDKRDVSDEDNNINTVEKINYKKLLGKSKEETITGHKTISFRNDKKHVTVSSSIQTEVSRSYSNRSTDISSGGQSVEIESFGNLHKHKKIKKIVKHHTVKYMKDNITEAYQKQSHFNKRRSNLHNFTNTESYTVQNTDITMPINNSTKSLTKETTFYTSQINAITNITNTTDTKVIAERNDVKVATQELTTKYTEKLNETVNVMVSNKTSTVFDFDNYVRNSDIKNIEDNGKKKEIEEKMRKDLNSLFSSPTTATPNTTETFTDIFKDLENEFDLN